LLQTAQQGDAEAFGQLYEQYAPQVFRYLYAHLDGRMDAEDLTGEVFVRVWRALPGYRQTEAPFGSFLFRVARNVLYDHYRRLRPRRNHKPLDEERMAEHASDPGEEHLQNFEHQELRKILDSLHKDQRNVLVLRFFAGLTPEETAQAMGKSNGAVRVLQHRALAALRKILLKESDVHKRNRST
jgi:RNA polymerase sigma-70 factor (ECF subfamily)